MPPAAPTGPAPGAPVLAPKSDVADVRKSIGVPYSPEPGPVMGQGYVGPLGDNFKNRPLLARLNWLHVPLLASTPILAIYGLLTATHDWRTWAFAVLYYFFSGLGITAGYHRLFAHKAYKATPALRWFLMLAGTAAVEGSIRWWARDHRAHHRYVDTVRDPYSAIKGFFYAHIGWMLIKQDKENIGRADITDLNTDPICRLQHKYYLLLAPLMGLVVPTLACGLLWGDYWGGYFIAGVARLVMVHHSTFFVNSLAHYAGAATYTDGHTARNSWITALLTLGEGYHNFHHEFPNDYRNGIEWYQYDPTKLFIRACAALGCAYDLNVFPQNEVEKGVLQMKQKALDVDKLRVDWGPTAASLPVWTRAQFEARAGEEKAKWAGGDKSARILFILDGFVLDVAPFLPLHPGGGALLSSEIGNDVTEKFKGGYYKHSNAARNMQAMYRVARVQGYWE